MSKNVIKLNKLQDNEMLECIILIDRKMKSIGDKYN
jgi:hypothetical protein